MNTKLLLIFSEKIFKEANMNLDILDNHLQIAFQILINKGYEVLVSGDGERSFEFGQQFVHIFQDEHIKITENQINELQKVDLMKNSNCIICFQREDIKLAQSIYGTFIFIDIEAKNAEERSDILQNFDVFMVESLNAGQIVKKIEELINSKMNMKEETAYNTQYKNTVTINDSIVSSDEEFENYKEQIKKTIEKFISCNKLDEAKNIIREYESIVKDDVDTYSMKAIIFIMEGNLEASEKVLKEAISIYKDNFDLFYNLAYTYKLKQNYFETKKYYLKSKELTKDEKILAEIQSNLSEIEILK